MASPLNAIETELAKKMMGVFGSVISNRAAYFQTHSQEGLDQKSVESIIRKYAAVNAAISGGASLMPGPFGIAAAIPEIILVIRNQIAMIYDIGRAEGKQPNLLKPEILAGIFIAGAGIKGIQLLTVHSGKILAKRASPLVWQLLISLITKKVSQQLMKSMVVKCLPAVGAAAMAAWSNYSTHIIGKQAIAILSQPIEYVDSEYTDPEIHPQTSDVVELPPPPNLDLFRIVSLINLMKVDQDIAIEEVQYICACMEKSNLSTSDKMGLLQAMKSDSKLTVNYSVFKDNPEESLALLMDLVALAARDGQVHLAEKLYIKQVGQTLGFTDRDIEDLISLSSSFDKVLE